MRRKEIDLKIVVNGDNTTQDQIAAFYLALLKLSETFQNNDEVKQRVFSQPNPRMRIDTTLGTEVHDN
jgi:hypothetical protein